MDTTRNLPGRLSGVLIVIVFLAIVGLLFAFPPESWVPAQQLGALLESTGGWGVAVFLAAGSSAIAFGLPRQLLAFVAGLSYGVGIGMVLSLLAAVIGCYLTVRLSEKFLSDWVSNRYPVFITRLEHLLRNDVFVKVLALRLQPFGTNLLTNLCIGLTSVSRKEFLTASALGYVPQMLVFALLGAGVRVGSDTQMGLSIVLFGLSIGLGAYIYSRHMQRKPAP